MSYCFYCGTHECRIRDAEARERQQRRVSFVRVPSSGAHVYEVYRYVGEAGARIGWVERVVYFTAGRHRKVARRGWRWIVRDAGDRKLPGTFRTRRAAATALLGAR